MSTVVHEKLLPRLPEDLRKQLEVARLQVHYKERLPTDGLFIPAAELDSPTLNPALKEATRDLSRTPGLLHLVLKEDLLKSESGLQVLAHEFFHAVHYMVNPNEETWKREGLAQFFEALVLGRMNGYHVRAALKAMSTPLVSDFVAGQVTPAAYGQVLLYFVYLTQNCGGEPLFWDIVRGRSIDAALSIFSKPSDQTPMCRNFDASVVHFEVARMHNKTDYTTGSRAHLLLPTTEKGPFPLDAFDRNAWSALPRHASLLLKGSVTIPRVLIETAHVYYLESIYPYRVLSQTSAELPEKSANWRILLIKK